MKRKPRDGSIIRIELPSGKSAFGQVLAYSSLAIFESNQNDLSTLDEILELDVLFIIAVYNHAYRTEN